MTDYFTAEQVYQSLKEENAALRKFCRETRAENETLRTGYAAARLEIESLKACAGSEPVAHLWQHSETGRTRVVMPDAVVDASASWLLVGPLYLHPSPPEGMVGGWVSVDERLPKCSRKPDSLGVEVLIWPPHEDGSRTAFYGRRQSQNPNFYKYGALLGHVGFWQYPPAPPTTSAGSGKGK